MAKITPRMVKEAVKKCDALRRHTKVPVDISLAQFFKANQGVSMETVYNDLGLNPTWIQSRIL